MEKALIDHAIANVWSSPGMDKSVVFQLDRITGYSGARKVGHVMRDTVKLPTSTDTYHLYQIGQNWPGQINFPYQEDEWIKVSDWCKTAFMVADLYVDSGLQLPRTTSYILRMQNRNFVIAVKVQPKICNLSEELLRMRIYSNAYYQSARHNTDQEYVEVAGGLMTSVSDIVSLQNKLSLARARGGEARVYWNGRSVQNISPIWMSATDIVEYIWDGSYTDVVDLKLSDLPTFMSTKDSMMKYLLHPPKDNDGMIIYYDDIDIMLYKVDDGIIQRGVYYHRNDGRAIRMVTHRDYALPSSFVNAYITENAFWDNTDNLYVRLFIRKKSGYLRELVYVHNRIQELYRMDDTGIMQAFTGVNSLITEWTAPVLEASDYCTLIGAKYKAIDGELVMGAYGYNAASKILADGPIVLDNSGGIYQATLPAGLRENAIIFEYDVDGKMLGWYQHTLGSLYNPVNTSCRMIEGYSGIAQHADPTVYGNDPVTLNKEAEYRLYVSPAAGGVATGEWSQIESSDESHVQILDGVVNWTHRNADFVGAVKQNDKVICYDITSDDRDDLYRFNFTNQEGVDDYLAIQPETVLIWMNGYTLVPGIDYHMEWPQVVVFNKRYLEDDGQKFTILMLGFCEDMAIRQPKETGHIMFGLMSYDEKYSLRDDKVMRYVIGGKIKPASKIKFAENYGETGKDPLTNGLPYMSTEIPVPIRDVTDYVTYIGREESEDLDKRIEDYLSLKLPQVDLGDFVGVPDWYHVYSPMMSKLIADIRDGFLTIPELPISDDTVRSLCAPYTYLVDYDPCRLDSIDRRFIVVDPFPKEETVGVQKKTYYFLTRVNLIYLKNRLNLSPWLTLVGDI